MYRFVVSDLQGVNQGEIRSAHSRRLYLPLNHTPVVSFTARWDEPLIVSLLTDDLLLKVYDGTTLRFHGYVSAVDGLLEAENSSVSLVVTGATRRFQKRLAGKSAAGTVFAGQDRGAVVKSVIDTTNAESNTGVQTQTITTGSTVTYTAGPYKPVSQVISDMADALDGFDWYEQPQEWAAGKLSTLVGQPLVGAVQPNAVFEYGVGRANVRSVKRSKSWAELANQVFHIDDAGPAAPSNAVVSASDAASIAARGLYEDIVDASGIADLTLRQRLVAEHVAVRRQPRIVYTLTPAVNDDTGRVPVFGTDYGLGDSVPVRAKYGGTTLWDGYLRVFAVAIEVDDNGQASVAPIVQESEVTDE